MISLSFASLSNITRVVWVSGVMYMVPFVVFANRPIESPISETFIKNPLATGTIVGFLEAILTVVMVLSVPVIIFFIIYAGFLYVTARGNSEQVQKATAALTYAVVGGLIVLGALVIVQVISNLVAAFMTESG